MLFREAKIIKNRTDSPQPGHEKSEDSSNIITDGKRTPKPKYPKGVSPEHITPGKAKAFKVVNLRSFFSFNILIYLIYCYKINSFFRLSQSDHAWGLQQH